MMRRLWCVVGSGQWVMGMGRVERASVKLVLGPSRFLGVAVFALSKLAGAWGASLGWACALEPKSKMHEKTEGWHGCLWMPVDAMDAVEAMDAMEAMDAQSVPA